MARKIFYCKSSAEDYYWKLTCTYPSQVFNVTHLEAFKEGWDGFGGSCHFWKPVLLIFPQ